MKVDKNSLLFFWNTKLWCVCVLHDFDSVFETSSASFVVFCVTLVVAIVDPCASTLLKTSTQFSKSNKLQSINDVLDFGAIGVISLNSII